MIRKKSQGIIQMLSINKEGVKWFRQQDKKAKRINFFRKLLCKKPIETPSEKLLRISGVDFYGTFKNL